METALNQGAITSLRILWVDDDLEDLSGFDDYLKARGHSVQFVASVAGAEAILANRPVDLLILDQKIGSATEGGTGLIGRLKAGELGELNRQTWFMFFTGSEDWVWNADIDVEALRGCLVVEEKGQVLEDIFEEHLHQVVPNARSSQHSDEYDNSSKEQQRYAEVKTEVWQGVILRSEGEHFSARLSCQSRPAPEYEATFPLSRVAEEARVLIEFGTKVVLTLRARDEGTTRRVVSELTVTAPPSVDHGRLTSAVEGARQRRASR